MRKVLFLDRDGVVNRERGAYTYRQADFVFNPDLFDVLLECCAAGFEIIIITNQGGIAKGLYSVNDFRSLTTWMESELAHQGIEVLHTYFSPDHDDYSKSLTRKPAKLLFDRAIARYGVDISSSIMIGDSQRDIDAAQKAGVHGILIEANSSLNEIKRLILAHGQ